ncbi:MAG: UvrD-helicase domain-containing protein [Bacteroidota bacterium]
MNLKIISAGAGSGKTYRLTQEMVRLLKEGVRASGIIATTFTTKAAAELKERVRIKLLEEGMTAEANELSNALIGTVHGLGVKLLKRFAFEAGVSPQVDIIADEDQQLLFNNALATVLTNERIRVMEACSERLGLSKREYYDWRRELKNLTDTARANDFSIEVLEYSKTQSFESFAEYLPKVSEQSAEHFNQRLLQLLEDTLQALEANEDETKKTQGAANTLRGFRNALKLKGALNWHEWAKIGKISVGAKSRDDVEALQIFAQSHDSHPEFHQDIQTFISSLFDIAIAAIREYEEYKKQRGLIDYIDMEIHVKRLLDQEGVQETLREELDLLMVDEFQDTNPIQLEIFLKLSKIAHHSVWVGDPKQSIYGFRGADPKLMQAIIEQNGGIQPEDIQAYSWRSRQDIVNATNALFTKAFSDLPPEQVALQPKRTKLATPDSQNQSNEPIEVLDALMHWHFQTDTDSKRLPGRPWMENCIATTIRQQLERETLVLPKGTTEYRQLRPGDIAILCRSNAECLTMAEALHRAGLKAAIARNGLLNTAEARLILAGLKFVLHRSDSLSVAEILLLAARMDIEEIIDNRLEYLEKIKDDQSIGKWAADDPFIQRLNELRPQIVDLSGAEILDLLLEELDLRRIIASWGRQQQRMDNVDVLRKLALQYEEACNRMHSAASLGGFLLWLNELGNKGRDAQGSGEGPQAVNVLTYHKSKGLEWPMVICHSLEGQLRDRIWGLDIVAESETVDLDNLMGNRWVRYWINPYADQYRGTQLIEKLEASPVKAQAKAKALEEEARLLYVGITRARDYLVFPTRQRPPRWLNRIWHNGQEDYPTLDIDNHETPWEWNDEVLLIDNQPLIFPKDFVHYDQQEEAIFYLEDRTGSTPHLPHRIEIPKEGFDFKARLKRPQAYAPALELPEEQLHYQTAKACKVFWIADHPDRPAEYRQAMAEAILHRFELAEEVKITPLLRNAQAFFTHLQKHYPAQQLYRKYPIRSFYQQRLFETIIDFVLIMPDQSIVLIQNSGFAGEAKQWKTKAAELKDWLHLSKLTLQAIFGTQRVRTLVHFILGSTLMEVETTVLSPQPLADIKKR